MIIMRPGVGLMGATVSLPTVPSITWASATHFTLSNGNRTATYDTNAAYNPIVSSTSKNSGKWYVELLVTTKSVEDEYGFSSISNPSGYIGFQVTSWGAYDFNGSVYNNGSIVGSLLPNAPVVNGNIIMLAIDAGSGKMWWGKNGTWGADPTTGNSSVVGGAGTYWLAISASGEISGQSAVYTLANTLTYSLPSGFGAW